jgi:predicted nuclease of predicted toxin-antitoxin system
MSLIRIYLDEDVRPLLATILRERGYDAVSAVELGRLSIPDADHFEYAATNNRSLLTFNIRDFVPLATRAIEEGRHFSGLIVTEQIPFSQLLRRTLRLVGAVQSEEIADRVVWLADYR